MSIREFVSIIQRDADPCSERDILPVSAGDPADGPAALGSAPLSDAERHDLVTTLFDLGRQVTSVLDLDELLPQSPRLMGRLISFEAFAVYLLDERRSELRAAYAVGYSVP